MGRTWTAYQEALHLGAAFLLQNGNLSFRLDAFGRRGDAYAAAKRGDGTHDSRCLGRLAEVVHKAPIDLDASKR